MNETTSSINTNFDKPSSQPAFYIPHGGGPCFFMDWEPSNLWNGMEAFLKSIDTRLPEHPKAILLISAHWQEANFSVTTNPEPALIYDYYGFPEHTYKLKYPAKGAPALAKRIVSLLRTAGLSSQEDAIRGFDHGMFIPLMLMFPKADIPVVQLSLRNDLNPQAHIKAGQALAHLREEGILIVGSGMSFHNMAAYGNSKYSAASNEFDTWLTTTVEASIPKMKAELALWYEAPSALDSHPLGSEEHLIPLMVVAGTARKERGRKVYSEQIYTNQVSAFMFK